MPIYEYACKACGKAMEIRQKIADDPLQDCPECGQPALERLVSASSFALKGSGWYADGYGGAKPETKSAEGSKESSAKDAKDAPKKSESPSSESKPKDTKPSGDMKKAS